MESGFSGLVEPPPFASRAAPCDRSRLPYPFPGLAALALAACVGYEPDPLEPREALRLLDQRAEQDVQVEHAGPWSAEWFPLEAEVRLADGLALGEANALALFYSPALQTARADARIAGAQVLQAGVLANPQLFLGPRVSTQDAQVIFPVSLGWQLPLWGTRAAQHDRAAAHLTEKGWQVAELELDTLRQVRAAFLRLARLRREEAVLEAVATTSRQVARWVEDLRAAGETDSVALFLARIERDDARGAVEDVRDEAIRARKELLALLGLLPDAPVELAMGAAAQLPELGDPESEALLSLPALLAAEAAYAAAEAALRVEIGKQYPTISVGPQFEDDRGDATLGIGIGVTLPLFDRNRGNIAAAEEARQRARESYEHALLAAAHTEARARDDLRAAERVLAIYREGAMQDAEDASRALQIRLRAGRADVVEVLAAQRTIARARVRALELEERVAAARLHAAVAGGLTLRRPIASDEETNE